MSKKLKVFLSLLVIVLSVGITSALISTPSTFAYSGGLLDKQVMKMSPNINVRGLDNSWMTDGSDSSYMDFGPNDGINEQNLDTAYFKFTTPKTISSYKMLANAPKIKMIFYDSSKVLLKELQPITNATITPITPIENVTYVVLENTDTQASTQRVYEFDVFEQIVNPSESPSPEPTPVATYTPSPTEVPSPTPEQITGDRAILVITMNTGLEKEFDLPLSEINAFLNWYDSASGSSKYGVNKHDNNKGPFSKRTEYVVHDKILTFEVSEYAAQ